MSPLLWLQRLFVPKTDENGEDTSQEMDEGEGFTWNEHVRIVLAMLIVVISAFVMWWIII